MSPTRLAGGIGVVLTSAAILNQVLPSCGTATLWYTMQFSLTGAIIGLIEGYLIWLLLSSCVERLRGTHAVLLSTAWVLAETIAWLAADMLRFRLLWILGPLTTILVIVRVVNPQRSWYAGKALAAWMGVAIVCTGALIVLAQPRYDLAEWVWNAACFTQYAIVGLVGSWIAVSLALVPPIKAPDAGLPQDAQSGAKPASKGKRIAAAVIDLLLIPVVLGVAAGLLFLKCDIDGFARSAGLVVVNAVWLVLRDQGCDPGRRMIGLRLIRRDGGRVTVWQAIGRNIHLATPFVLIAAYLVEFVSILITGGRLADRWAGTTVVER